MDNKEKLYILWTNADEITSEKMVMMYAINAKVNNWWEDLTLIIWGATARLVTDNAMIQEKIRQAMHVGVKVSACIACADQLGVTDKLREMGIEVKGWGVGLTEALKDGVKVLSI